MTNEPYGLWVMAVLRTKQDVLKFALLYIPIGGMSSYGKFKNFSENMSYTIPKKCPWMKF